MHTGPTGYRGRPMPRRATLALSLALAAAAASATPAAGLTGHRCPRAPGFRCATVAVPLDRTGTVPGTDKLSIAVEEPRKGASGFLMALSGGPGQPPGPSAASFRASLGPALAPRHLVLFDQRATGASDVLTGPPLKTLGTLDVVHT